MSKINIFKKKNTKFQEIFNKKSKNVVKKWENNENKRGITSKKTKKYNIFKKNLKK